jgi:hypothetical protein
MVVTVSSVVALASLALNIALILYNYIPTTDCARKHIINTPIILVFDNNVITHTLPKQFRTSKQLAQIAKQKNVSSYGLEELNISGGGQYGVSQFHKLREELPTLQAIVDLRQECHGIANEMAVSWYGQGNAANIHYPHDNILQAERNNITALGAQSTVYISFVLKETATGRLAGLDTQTLDIKSTTTEQQLVQDANLQYLRFFITDHHGPTIPVVDKFIDFVLQWNQTYPVGSADRPYLYIHCRGGFGRTTSMMAVFDMIHNCKHVSFDQILARHALLGGRNLVIEYDPTQGLDGRILMKASGIVGSYRHYNAILRYNRLQHIYKYCKSNKDNFKTKYSTYAMAKHHMKV